jgi:4-amino-4-deoxy-L-arabinose transferase-like glycosyltransferase
VRLVPFGVAVVAAALFLSGLGAAPFIDPPEGFHTEIAREMLTRGDFVTPRLNAVRYFDKPPLLYWLISLSSLPAGPTPFAARFWSALAAVGVAGVTAYLGILLGGLRVGLLAGLMVAANMGIFLFGRFVKPDLLFILCMVLAYLGFVLAYLGRGRWPLALFYGALGLATLAKDVLGAIGPIVVVGLFFWLTRERPLRPWVPWWGVGLFCAIALPWYALVELRNRGFLWYTIVDNHLLNFTRQRAFPDEDVPLGTLEFVIVTVIAFLPWVLVVPTGAVRIFRASRESATDRLWILFALWSAVVIGFFAVAPFKLPHYGLPAFPALALIAARAWDDTIGASPGAAGPRALLLPVALVFVGVTLTLAAAWADMLPLPGGAMTAFDVTARNLEARGQAAAATPLAAFAGVVRVSVMVFLAGTVALAVAFWRRAPGAGVAIALATVLAFLPLAGNGMAEFARIRSARPIAEALVIRSAPGDLVMHEGSLENSGSLLLQLGVPIPVVDGRQSNLAFGATFPEARDIFWDGPRAREAWARPGRHFLISVVAAERSVVRAFPPERVHLLLDRGGRRLYSNQPDALDVTRPR